MRIKQKKLEDKMKDARKGVLYLDFLPVLQLKRFEYDFMRDTMIKIGILLKRFDDERVTKEDLKRAIEEQYGFEDETNPGFNYSPFKFTKYSNAYMLVYIRESDMENCDVDEKEVEELLRV